MAEAISKFLQLWPDLPNTGIVITDVQHTVLYINSSAQRLLNVPGNTGVPLSAIIPREGIPQKENIVKCGNLTLSINVYPVIMEDVPIYFWHVVDITGEINKDNEILCLRAIIDCVDEGIILSDGTNRITLYNKALSNFEEIDPDQAIGRRQEEVYTSNENATVLATGISLGESFKGYSTTSGKQLQGMGKTYPVIRDNQVIATFSIVRDVSAIRRLLSKAADLQSEAFPKKTSHGTRYTFSDIICQSPAMINAIRKARKMASSSSPILISGETGTGKEVFAQSIHNYGQNQAHPFVGVNCAAIPEHLLESLLFGTVKGSFTGSTNLKGLFEQAANGALFLDEINSMPIALQAKLLRVLQEKSVRRIGGTSEIPVNCRVISSCSENPEQCVMNGTLRKDLYYRLAIIRINIPPLRERGADIIRLAEFFVGKFAPLYGKNEIRFSDDFRLFISQYNWPGNVRELEYTLESCVAMLDDNEDELIIQNLPSHLRSKVYQKDVPAITLTNTITLADALKEVERKIIMKSLEDHDWNIASSARAIGIGRQNMQYRIRKLGIEKTGSRPE